MYRQRCIRCRRLICDGNPHILNANGARMIHLGCTACQAPLGYNCVVCGVATGPGEPGGVCQKCRQS